MVIKNLHLKNIFKIWTIFEAFLKYFNLFTKFAIEQILTNDT